MGSVAVQNDLSPAGLNRPGILLEFFQRDIKGPGNHIRIGIEFERVPNIQEQEVFPGIEFVFQLFRSDAGHAQGAEEPLPFKNFP